MSKKVSLSILVLVLFLMVAFVSCTPNNTNQQANSNQNSQPLPPKGVAEIEAQQSIRGLLRENGFYSSLDEFISREVPDSHVKGVGEILKAGNMTFFDLDLDSNQGGRKYYCLGRCLTTREGKTYWLFESIKDRNASNFFEHVLQLESGNLRRTNDNE